MEEIIKIIIIPFLGGIGFIIFKFILDPILKQKLHITKVIEYLISHADRIANPGNDNIKERNNISTELRNLSSGLTSKTVAIPVYTFFEIARIVKNKSKIAETAEDLIRLSNSLFEDCQDINLRNSKTLEKIYNRLGVKIN